MFQADLLFSRPSTAGPERGGGERDREREWKGRRRGPQGSSSSSRTGAGARGRFLPKAAASRATDGAGPLKASAPGSRPRGQGELPLQGRGRAASPALQGRTPQAFAGSPAACLAGPPERSTPSRRPEGSSAKQPALHLSSPLLPCSPGRTPEPSLLGPWARQRRRRRRRSPSSLSFTLDAAVLKRRFPRRIPAAHEQTVPGASSERPAGAAASLRLPRPPPACFLESARAHMRA